MGPRGRGVLRGGSPVLGAICPHESTPEGCVRGFPGIMFRTRRRREVVFFGGGGVTSMTTGGHIHWVGDSKPSDVLVSFDEGIIEMLVQ